MSIDELKSRFNSERWLRFLSNFFGDAYTMWHDGYDEGAVLGLSQEEKQVAEEILIKSISENGMWSAAGLALLHSQKGVPVMKEKLARTKDDVNKIRLADAILQITNEQEFLPILIHCAIKGSFWGDRAEAARLLRKYHTPEVIEALFKAVVDGDYLVRVHACDSLLTIYGLPADISEYKEIFDNIRENTPVKKYLIAQEQLRKLFNEKGKVK